jgi:hypothetical protein
VIKESGTYSSRRYIMVDGRAGKSARVQKLMFSAYSDEKCDDFFFTNHHQLFYTGSVASNTVLSKHHPQLQGKEMFAQLIRASFEDVTQ